MWTKTTGQNPPPPPLPYPLPHIPLLPNTPTDVSTWVVAMVVTRTNTRPDNVVPTKNPLLPLFQAVSRGASELFIGDCWPHSDRYSWRAGRCPGQCPPALSLTQPLLPWPACCINHMESDLQKKTDWFIIRFHGCREVCVEKRELRTCVERRKGELVWREGSESVERRKWELVWRKESENVGLLSSVWELEWRYHEISSELLHLPSVQTAMHLLSNSLHFQHCPNVTVMVDWVTEASFLSTLSTYSILLDCLGWFSTSRLSPFCQFSRVFLLWLPYCTERNRCVCFITMHVNSKTAALLKCVGGGYYSKWHKTYFANCKVDLLLARTA